MSDKDSAKNVIDSYRKRQQMTAPLILGVAAVLLVVLAAYLIFWASGAKLPQISLAPATATATPTDTATPTNTTTPTFTPTDTATLPPPTNTPTPTLTATPSGPSWYVVQENDTLFGIAVKFNVDLLTLFALNPQIDPANPIIKVGDKIVIPAPNTTLPSATPLPTGWKGTIEYTVASGDTLADIAARFNSTVAEIVKLNNLLNANDIKVGQKIKIPVNIATPIPTVTAGTIYPTIPPQPSATKKP